MITFEAVVAHCRIGGRGLDFLVPADIGAEPGASLALRARASILVISEALTEHGAYFDRGARV